MADGPFVILVVCRANECRSPAVAASLRRQTATSVIPIEVVSAGIDARAGSPADPVMGALIARRGIDLSGHASQQVARATASQADLVISASRAQLRFLVADVGVPFERAFTLRELARRTADSPPRQPGEQLADWIARLATGRSPRQMLGRAADDDLADPTGRHEDHYVRCLAQIESSVSVICQRGLLDGG